MNSLKKNSPHSRPFMKLTLVFILTISTTLSLCTASDKPEYVLRAVTSMEKLMPDSFKKSWLKSGINDAVELYSSRNESESFQIAIVPFKDLSDVTWKVTGDIEPNLVHISPVGYVNVQKPMNHISIKNYPDEDDIPGLWPDPIYSTRKSIQKVPANRIQPLWVTFNIPKDFKPGKYNVKITVSAKNSKLAVVNAVLNVWNFSLPDRANLRTCFYFQDWFINMYYPEIKDQALLNLKKQYWKMALDNRINPTDLHAISKINIQHDKNSGKYSFEFTKASKARLKFLLEENGKKANLITVTNGRFDYGSPGPMSNGKYLDFRGEKIFSDAYKNFLIQYLDAWKKYLKKNSWTQYGSMLFVDEPGKTSWKEVKHLCPIVKKAAPEWPVYGAVNYQPSAVELQNYIDIMAPGFGSNFNSANLPFYENLVKKGREVWGYICFKASCINFQSIDHRMQIWICWNYGLKGYLYWGTVNWFQRASQKIYPDFYAKTPEKRWPNGSKTEWKHTSFDNSVPGDGYLIYPSPEGPPWSSIRLENYRDGIEDYDYFCILRNEIKRIEKLAPENKGLIKRAKKLLNLQGSIIQAPNVYTRDFTKMLERRKQIGNMIVEIQTKLK